MGLEKQCLARKGVPWTHKGMLPCTSCHPAHLGEALPSLFDLFWGFLVGGCCCDGGYSMVGGLPARRAPVIQCTLSVPVKVEITKKEPYRVNCVHVLCSIGIVTVMAVILCCIAHCTLVVVLKIL